jgi:hypothetical protein
LGGEARVGGWAGRAGVLVCTALAACGTPSPNPLAVVSAVPRQTVGAGSARTAYAAVVRGREPGEDLHLDGGGAFDLVTRRGTFTLDLPQIGRTETLVIGDTSYRKVPELGDLSPGTSWLRVDAGSSQPASDLTRPSSVVRLLAEDPGDVVEYLDGVVGEVRTLGRDAVRGVPTTHYATVVDLHRAAAHLQPTAQRNALRLAEALGTAQVGTDVWVDGRGRARRQQLELDYASAPPTGGSDEGVPSVVTFTVELFAFGVAVKADPPPPDQTIDLSRVGGLADKPPG